MNMIELETRDQIWDTLIPFSKWIPKSLIRNLVLAKDSYKILSVSVSNNTSTKKSRWDGLLLINLNDSVCNTEYVINAFVSVANAHEICMEDSKTLRLWWD